MEALFLKNRRRTKPRAVAAEEHWICPKGYDLRQEAQSRRHLFVVWEFQRPRGFGAGREKVQAVMHRAKVFLSLEEKGTARAVHAPRPRLPSVGTVRDRGAWVEVGGESLILYVYFRAKLESRRSNEDGPKDTLDDCQGRTAIL